MSYCRAQIGGNEGNLAAIVTHNCHSQIEPNGENSHLYSSVTIVKSNFVAEQDHFTAQKLPAEKDLGWIKHHGAIIGIGSGMDLWAGAGTERCK